MADNWHVGNAVTDSKDWRGWFVGHFLDDASNIRASDAVEIKWGVHPKGEGRDSWHTGEQRTTVVLLVKGRPYRPVDRQLPARRRRRLRHLGTRRRPFMARRRGLRRHHRPMAVQSRMRRQRSLRQSGHGVELFREVPDWREVHPLAQSSSDTAQEPQVARGARFADEL